MASYFFSSLWSDLPRIWTQFNHFLISSLLSHLQRDTIAAPGSRDFFKSREQYWFSWGGGDEPIETAHTLLTTSAFFCTPRTPPSPIVPIGGHSRFPQSKLLQLLQKLSRTCFIWSDSAPKPLLYVNMSGLPKDMVKISTASLIALPLYIPPLRSLEKSSIFSSITVTRNKKIQSITLSGIRLGAGSVFKKLYPFLGVLKISSWIRISSVTIWINFRPPLKFSSAFMNSSSCGALASCLHLILLFLPFKPSKRNSI